MSKNLMHQYLLARFLKYRKKKPENGATTTSQYSALVGDTRLSKAFENRIEALSKHIDCTALTAAFILATRQGHERLALSLLASPKIKPNTRDTDGFTALIWSAIKGLEKAYMHFSWVT